MKKSIVVLLISLVAITSIAAMEHTDPIQLSFTERISSNSVAYLSGVSIQDFEYGQRLFFSLKDKNEKELSVPCYVDVRIVNDLSGTVFQKSFKLNSNDFGSWGNDFRGYHTMASIDIYSSQIEASNCDKGTIYFTVYSPNYFLFDEMDLSIENLPFKADYSNPINISAGKFDNTFENKLKAKKEFGSNPVQMKVMAKSMMENYDGTYMVSCYDYSSYESYSITLYFDKTQLDQLAEIDMNTKINVIGFVDYDAYSPTLVHCMLK